ncbi:hypothetical protein ACFWRZ_32420 [Streptomyces rubiginosohelvolus]
MHRIEARCSGRATSNYPETVVVQAYEPGGRTVEAVSSTRSCGSVRACGV